MTDIRDIFNAPKRDTAEQRLKQAVAKYADIAPQLSAWMEANLPEGLTVFIISTEKHRKRLRTSNWLENLNGKINKRTSVVGLFPSIESLLRLVSAVLMETDEMQTSRFLFWSSDVIVDYIATMLGKWHII